GAACLPADAPGRRRRGRRPPMAPRDDELGSRAFGVARVHDARLPLWAHALERPPPGRGERAQAGGDGRRPAVGEPRRQRDAPLLERPRHPRANLAVPTRARARVAAPHAQPLPGVPGDGPRAPAVEEAGDGLRRAPELAGRVRPRRVDQPSPGPRLGRLRVGAARRVPRAPWRRRGGPRTAGTARPWGPKLEPDGHVEPGPRAPAHGGIPPVQVADLPAAAAAWCPLQRTLDGEDPVALRRPLRRTHPPIGPVPRHRHEGVQRDASPTPSVPRSSPRKGPGATTSWGPSRPFRESQNTF